MNAGWWATFWPLLALMVATCTVAFGLIVAVAVPVRCVLHRQADWVDVGVTIAAGLLAVAGTLAAGLVLSAVGLA